MTKLEQLRAALETVSKQDIFHLESAVMRNRLRGAERFLQDAEDYADRILARYEQLRRDGVL